MVPVPGHWDDGGMSRWLVRGLDEKPITTEAGVALASVRVEDSEARVPARWTRAIARDHHLRSLTDDVSPEADP
jgi:hypothetical protein